MDRAGWPCVQAHSHSKLPNFCKECSRRECWSKLRNNLNFQKRTFIHSAQGTVTAVTTHRAPPPALGSRATKQPRSRISWGLARTPLLEPHREQVRPLAGGNLPSRLSWAIQSSPHPTWLDKSHETTISVLMRTQVLMRSHDTSVFPLRTQWRHFPQV